MDQFSVPVDYWVVYIAFTLVVADYECAGWLVYCDERGETVAWAYFILAGLACELGDDGVSAYADILELSALFLVCEQLV